MVEHWPLTPPTHNFDCTRHYIIYAVTSFVIFFLIRKEFCFISISNDDSLPHLSGYGAADGNPYFRLKVNRQDKQQTSVPVSPEQRLIPKAAAIDVDQSINYALFWGIKWTCARCWVSEYVQGIDMHIYMSTFRSHSAFKVFSEEFLMHPE